MLRRLAQGDAAALQELIQESLGYVCSLEQVKKQLETALSSPSHLLIGYEEEAGRLVGFLHAEIYTSLLADTGLNILALAVLPSFQGQGIGSQLMEAVEDRAEAEGYAFIRLNSGSQRKEAHAFYEKLGYEGEKTQLRFIKFLKENSDDFR